MKYIDSTLIEGEKIILTPQIHKIVYIKPFIFLGVMTILLLLSALASMDWSAALSIAILELPVLLIVGIWHLYDKLYYGQIEMAVAKTGIISVHTEELQWNKIESIEIRQGVLGRWLNYGEVYFSGTGTSYVRFGDVQDPWKVKSQSAEILST